MGNEVKKVLFIINKYSGTGYQPKLEGRILDVGTKQDAECTLEFTQGRGHATELAMQGIERKFDWIVAVGGDGTINEVARGMLHSNVPMGIIPRGSGNGLARHLHIPISITKAVESLFKSQPLQMDTFTVNNRLSLNVSGIGFDGHIANQFDKNGKRGLAGYAKITVREYIQFKEFEASVTTPEKEFSRNAFIIAIANSSQYGNNARIAPQASVCDQKLHVSFLHKVPPYRLDFMYALFRGKVDQSAYCSMVETDSLMVKTNHPVAYHIDGEPCGVDSLFTIKLLPASIRILVPPAAYHKV